MKISIGKLVDSHEALGELSNSKLPAVTAMRVAMLLQTCKAPLAAFEQSFNQLLKDCGEQVEGVADRYTVKDVERYNKELTELRDAEIDLPVTEKLSNLGNAEIKPAALLALDWLIQI